MEFTITLSDMADDAVRRAISTPLVAYNEGQAGPSEHQPLVLSVQDANGAVIGGLWGATSYGWLYTQLLLVPNNLRGQGLGSQLMQQAEAEAIARGCANAWVDTQFGAKSFYERLGYAVFGELLDYPPGFSRSYLRKRLS